ncbi:hypothetical protein [Stenotrophomonas indicatrix]|uniref:hypothetical protein n=1 Tax=Stenotrophomonas indicatrix TaxID=2045451 RepID=UPI0034309F0C
MKTIPRKNLVMSPLSATAATLGRSPICVSNLAFAIGIAVSIGSPAVAAPLNGKDSVIGDGSGTLPSLWEINEEIVVGSDDFGELALSGGGKVLSAPDSTAGIRLGVTSESSTKKGNGSLTVDGEDTSFATSGAAVIGDSGQGFLAVSQGAAVSAGSVVIADHTGTSGYATVSDGELTTSGELYVGNQGAGALMVSNGGSVLAAGNIYAGYNNADTQNSNGASNRIEVTGAGSIVHTDGHLTVGNVNGAYMTIVDRARVSTGLWAIIGNSGAGAADVFNDSRFDVGGELSVGHNTLGELRIGRGGIVTSQMGRLGRFSGGDGRVSITAGGTWSNTGDLTVGDAGVGRFYIEENGLATNVNASIGSKSGSEGYVSVAATSPRLE